MTLVADIQKVENFTIEHKISTKSPRAQVLQWTKEMYSYSEVTDQCGMTIDGLMLQLTQSETKKSVHQQISEHHYEECTNIYEFELVTGDDIQWMSPTAKNPSFSTWVKTNIQQ